MARRRFIGKRARRATHWESPVNEIAFTNVAVNNGANIVIATSTDEETIVRIVGTVVMSPQVISGETVMTCGVYHLRALSDTVSTPSSNDFLESEEVMWVKRLHIPPAGPSMPHQFDVDIRVARKLQAESSLVLSMVGHINAWKYMAQLRVLYKSHA